MNLITAIGYYHQELSNLQSILDKLEEVKKYADTVETTTLESKICKRYLYLGTAELVAKEVNAAGFKKNGKIYTGRDITSVIEQKKLMNVDPVLHSGAQL